ncbi:S26 family signal peptidase [Streptomyces sp. NPDC127068]|uniref:S26 family signal peptidase n=1 Tax=Streptomyces sp. NPDC127068 TaxID=3347127 RepID=UPI00364EB42C
MGGWSTAGLCTLLTAAALTTAHVRKSFRVVAVRGDSMAPTLQNGERVVVRCRTLAEVGRGDVVVLKPPRSSGPSAHRPDDPGWNIKRVVALPGDPVPADTAGGDARDTVPPGSLVVFGDGPDSIDSRHRGFFDGDRLLGIAVRRLGGAPL